jgi:hypothetical protein
MNFEGDEPERLAWTWDGLKRQKIARAEWLAERRRQGALISAKLQAAANRYWQQYTNPNWGEMFSRPTWNWPARF